MKRFLKYFFILFATLLIGNIIIAKSNEVSILFENTQVQQGDTAGHVALDRVIHPEYKHYFTNLDSCADRIEVSESETDVEDFSIGHQLVSTVNYFTSYLNSNLFGQLDCFTSNGLAPCKHIFYLTTIESFNIIFCVFRI